MPHEIIIESGGLSDEIFLKHGGRVHHHRHHRNHHHHHHHGGGARRDCPTWEEVDRLREDNEALVQERDGLRAAGKTAAAELARREAEACRLREEVAALRREADEARRAHGGCDDRCREWRNKWTRERNENDALRDAVRARDDKLAKADAYAARLVEQAARLRADLELWRRRMLRLESENKHLRWKLEYYESAPIPRRRC